MKSHFPASTAILATIAALVAWPGASVGSVIASLNNPGSATLHEVTVAPGGSFSVDVSMEPAPALVGMNYRLVASAPDILTFAGATLHQPWDPTMSLVPLGVLAPTSETVYLGVSTFGPQPVSFPVATLSLAVAPDAEPGTYNLNLTEILCAGSRLTEPILGQAGQAFSITVLPEPSSLVLVALISAVLSASRVRKGVTTHLS